MQDEIEYAKGPAPGEGNTIIKLFGPASAGTPNQYASLMQITEADAYASLMQITEADALIWVPDERGAPVGHEIVLEADEREAQEIWDFRELLAFVCVDLGTAAIAAVLVLTAEPLGSERPREPLFQRSDRLLSERLDEDIHGLEDLLTLRLVPTVQAAYVVFLPALKKRLDDPVPPGAFEGVLEGGGQHVEQLVHVVLYEGIGADPSKRPGPQGKALS